MNKQPKMILTLFVLASLLLLAACGSSEKTTNAPTQESSHTDAAVSTDDGNGVTSVDDSAKPVDSEQSSNSSDTAKPADSGDTAKSNETAKPGDSVDSEDNVITDAPNAADTADTTTSTTAPEATETSKPQQKDDETPAPETKAKTYLVEIKDFAFTPEKLEIKAGDSVKFVNRDEVKHSATSDDAIFDTGLLAKDAGKVVTFDKEGEFPYHCTPHPGMKAMIVVTAN